MLKNNYIKWPKDPYKGLCFYDIEDRPLFAGRDDDINKCSIFLGSQSTSILLLHGLSGCGKSSFLRAGLIPVLEQNRYDVLKDDNNIIISGRDPLLNIIYPIYNYLDQIVKSDTQLKSRCSLINPKALFSRSINETIDRRNIIAYLLDILKQLDAVLTNRLIIAIDQAEEVITLNSNLNDNIQKSFFNFLAKYSNFRFNFIKIIIILRTEYYGRFSNLIRRRYLNRFSIGDYFLSDLNDQELINAIERSTLDINISPYGNPYKHYKFKYESRKLIKTIIDDLKRAKLPGSILPILQIVCKRLYQKSRKSRRNSFWEITYEDYKPFKNHQNQIISYVEETISSLAEHTTNNKENKYESFKWIKLLSILSKLNVDGTITSNIYNRDEFEKRCIEFHIRTPIDRIISQLCSDNIKILRKLKIHDSLTNNIIDAYSLSHDSIAYALKKWKDNIEKNIVIQGELSSPIIEASHLNKADLFGYSKSPQINLTTIDDHIWDHQIFLFAENKGFLERLGFIVKIKSLNEYSKYPYVQELLGRSKNEIVIIPYPRVLIKPIYKNSSSDFVITNVFTGYALIGRKEESIKHFDWSHLKSSFNSIINSLQNKIIMTEDEGAYNFAKSLEEISSYINKNKIELNIHKYQGQRGDLYSYFLEENKIDFIVGTAPLRAVSREFGNPIYFDSHDVKYLISNYISNNIIFNSIISNIFIHNCWNINIPINLWKNYKSTILRLTSVALFTIDYILNSKGEIASFIQKRLDTIKIYGKYELEESNFIDAFYRCYSISDSKNYYDNYFDSESFFYYERALKYYAKNINSMNIISNCHEVYKELFEYKNKYIYLADKYNSLNKNMIYRKENIIKSNLWRQRARKHFQIYNYYDASEFMLKAIKLVEKP